MSDSRVPGDEGEAVRALEPDAATLRAWLAAVAERIVRHVDSLSDQPAGYDADSIPSWEGHTHFPATATPLPALLDRVFDVAAPASFNTAGPGYMAYIPGGGLVQSAIADLIASAINRYVGVWVAAPLLASMEIEALTWMRSLMGLPETARGLLTSGGSLANLTAVVTARHHCLGESFDSGVLYVSDQAHHSVRKAATLAGFPRRAVVTVPTDGEWKLRPEALRRQVAVDRDAGRRPFMVVASAGTTNTGAVDPLLEIAEICAEKNLWLHVDAAYGGFFRLTRAGQKLLAGTEQADSITLDPHKGLFLPYGTGALLVRDGAVLQAAHELSADYMPAFQDAEPRGAYDFCAHGPELSRDFRGLRVWLPIQMHGIGPFVDCLDEKLDLTRHAARRLEGMDGIEIVAWPQLTVVAFRLVRPGADANDLDRLNARLLARVLASRKVWLTSTRLDGRVVLRICVLSFRTHRDRVETCLDLIEREVNALLDEPLDAGDVS
ncbi:MAG: pyridoxal phosphate-dependent decarboxylase family protein [Acidobacteriota bacterium]